MTNQEEFFYQKITSNASNRILPFLLESILDSSESDLSHSENDSTSEDEYLSDLNDDEINDITLYTLINRSDIHQENKNSQNQENFSDQWIVTSTANPIIANVQTALEAFSLIFDENILNIIVKNTNKEAVNQKESNWRLCDTEEIQAYLGVLILIGCLKLSHLSAEILWDEKYGPPIFRSVFALKRYKNLNHYLRFDDKSTRKSRKIGDRLAPVRDLFDQFNKNLIDHFIPGDNLTITEEFIPFDGNCIFKQCMATDPAQFGFKICWLCDTKTSYPLQGFPHVETIGESPSEDVIKRLCRPFYKSNRNVTLNETFADISLAQYLFKKGLTVTGRICPKRDKLPKEFLNIENRSVNSAVYGLHENVILLSYMRKPQAAELYLTTRHNHSLFKYMFNEQDDQKTEPPEVVQYYQNTQLKNSVTHLVNQYTVRLKRKQWPFIFFYNLVDIAELAAFLIYQRQHENQYKSRYEFLIDLANSLIEPLAKRSESKLKMDSVADENSEQAGSCNLCESSQEVSQSVKSCETCGSHVCKEHSSSIVICDRCFGR